MSYSQASNDEGREPTTESVQREYPQSPIPSAHAVVVREGKALLIRRANPPNKGRWSAPGGMVRLGETVRDAARREVHEECRIEIEPEGLVTVLDSIVDSQDGRVRYHYVVIYLLARHTGGEVHPGSDAAEARWVMKEELDGLDMHPLARRAVQQALEMAGESPGPQGAHSSSIGGQS